MTVTTIIPTLCAGGRRQQLLRAIESIHRASNRKVRILVVVNGDRFDSELVNTLRARSDLEVIQLAKGSQSNAQLIGRQATTSEFFSFLDDDDEYLAGALDIRRAVLEASPSSSVVVTNGYVDVDGRETALYFRTGFVAENPFTELFRENWLHNCNHLFRSELVPSYFFESAPPVLEWTWLAFRLCMEGKQIAACTETTFRYNDTPGSLSKSPTFLTARVEIYDRMIAAGPPSDILRMILRRTSSAWHEIAALELGQGMASKAARAHLKSMWCHWSGLKYASFSRHFLRRRNLVR